ncbi:DUF1003 domain-containing protein [Candidatus Woesearchaeota archaeon]|nr:DUF1003 domain-containing protein [Candidatus Woesearchaeota archaeon]
MQKRGYNDHNSLHGEGSHPIFRQKLTIGQKAADALTKFCGSWVFIAVFILILLLWIGVNSWFLLERPFDPYPYILLNLVLSSVAAVQAPIILMSQNRENERDRIYARYDYMVNRKAEREIQSLQKDVSEVKEKLRKISVK